MSNMSTSMRVSRAPVSCHCQAVPGVGHPTDGSPQELGGGSPPVEGSVATVVPSPVPPSAEEPLAGVLPPLV
jgi:hypothetical protein